MTTTYPHGSTRLWLVHLTSTIQDIVGSHGLFYRAVGMVPDYIHIASAQGGARSTCDDFTLIIRIAVNVVIVA